MSHVVNHAEKEKMDDLLMRANALIAFIASNGAGTGDWHTTAQKWRDELSELFGARLK